MKTKTADVEAGSLSRSTRNVTVQASKRKSKSKSTGKSKKKKSSADSQYSETDNHDLLKDEIGDASWLEVCTSCFIHTPREWLKITAGIILIFGCFYFFGLGVEMLASGARVMSGCQTVNLFSTDMNPVAEVMVGVLVTVITQSSSTTVMLIIGLVGAETLEPQQAIYMMMGANLGTSITNTIVALGQIGNIEEYEKAFAGAIIHDVFNWLNVAVLLPVEVITHYLFSLTQALVRGADPQAGETWEGPAHKIIKPLEELIIIPNEKIYSDISNGGAACQDYYPIYCEDPQNPTYATCNQTGLIACNKKTGKCPAFFDVQATQAEDQASGFVVFCSGIGIILISIFALVRILTYMLTGVSIRIVYKATNINGYLLILIGTGVTMILESSTTFNAFLVPLVGMGALRLEQTYALVVGTDFGTTLSALLAAMATDGPEGLQVALAYLMFNVTGFAIWYPVPCMRRVPIYLARNTARYARVWRAWPLLYLISVFGLLPLGVLGISALFESSKKGLVAVGSLLVILLGIISITLTWWCFYKSGSRKIYFYLKEKRTIRLALETLTTDLETAKLKIRHHQKCAGLPVSEDYSFNDTHGHGRLRGKKSTNFDESNRADEKRNEAITKAVKKLPKDMLYVQTALSLLDYHTGMKFDGDSDEEVESGGGSDDVEVGNEDYANITTLRKEREEIEHTSFVMFLKKVPIDNLVALVLSIPFIIWALVTLYMHGSKASVGAAGMLTILFGLLPLWWLKLWFIEADRIKVIQYFHNQETRDASIQKLPRSMSRIKREVKELLRHYKLSLSEDLVVGQSSGLETSTPEETSTN